jgi:TfoX/Sxy family transcriptional regulator of competence genes
MHSVRQRLLAGKPCGRRGRSEARSLFESITDDFRTDPHITTVKMFGGSALRVGKKVCPHFYEGKLVLKFPRERVAALVQSGDAQPFDSGTGRPAKEWVAIEPSRWAEWYGLAEEAKAFVASLP